MRKARTWAETQKAVQEPSIAHALADHWLSGRPRLFYGVGSFPYAAHALNVKLMEGEERV